MCRKDMPKPSQYALRALIEPLNLQLISNSSNSLQSLVGLCSKIIILSLVYNIHVRFLFVIKCLLWMNKDWAVGVDWAYLHSTLALW